MGVTTSNQTLCFVLSSARAGSTLLGRLLNCHSQIACPCEICVPYAVRSTWKLAKSVSNLRKISKHYHAKFPVPGGLLALRTVVSRFVEQLTACILAKEAKQTLVIKDPRHAAHWSKLVKLFPAHRLRFILLHRDVRAVVHSFQTTLGRKIERGFEVWQEAVRGMEACRQAFPDQTLVMRCEDLLTAPEFAMARAVQFLGYQFEPGMLNYCDFDHADNHLDLWSNKQLISTVNQGEIQPEMAFKWRSNEAVLNAYGARPEIQLLNESLGYLPWSEANADTGVKFQAWPDAA